MRTLNDWLSLYAESHQNPTNILIHKICVPVIMFTILAMLWQVPVPVIGNAAWILAVAALLFYVRISLVMTLGMTLKAGLMLGLIQVMSQAGLPVLSIAIGLFVVAWIFQFIGHKIEGKKPSFFTDIQFLLVGPAWTLSKLFNALGIKY